MTVPAVHDFTLAFLCTAMFHDTGEAISTSPDDQDSLGRGI